MFGSIRMVMIGLMLTGLAGGVAYVYKLKADNAILKENAVKLEQAVSSQQAVIDQQKNDFENILTLLGKQGIECLEAYTRNRAKGVGH